MKTNVQIKEKNHEGGFFRHISPAQKLKMLCMSYMLWEDSFYVDGKDVVSEIEKTCKKVDAQVITDLALKCHERGLLRHIPLFLIVQSLKKNKPSTLSIKEAIYKICTRPDQMTELLSLYWKEGRCPLSCQLKKGLAKAFTRFDEYQLSKYNRKSPIKLRDVLFLCHAKPNSKEQEDLWKRLVEGKLKPADTWERRLSSGEDKKESFDTLLKENKIGKLAILRNLRNMFEVGVDRSLVKKRLTENNKPMLPFQFLAAAKECPAWEDVIEESMMSSCQMKTKFSGTTAIFVDVSGSMENTVSGKSKTSLMEAACGLAILLKEMCEFTQIYTFSERLVGVPNRRGIALRDCIINSQKHSSTYMWQALDMWKKHRKQVKVDRIFVITDEQDAPGHPYVPINGEKCYMLNIGSYSKGVDLNSQWLRICGFSEFCIDYVQELENEVKIEL